MTVRFESVDVAVSRLRAATNLAIAKDRADAKKLTVMALVAPPLAAVSAAVNAAGPGITASALGTVDAMLKVILAQLKPHSDIPQRKMDEYTERTAKAEAYRASASQAHKLASSAPGWLGETQAKYRDTATVCARALDEVAERMESAAEFCKTVAAHHEATFVAVAAAINEAASNIFAANPGFPSLWGRCMVVTGSVAKAQATVARGAHGQIGENVIRAMGQEMNSVMNNAEVLQYEFRANPELAKHKASASG